VGGAGVKGSPRKKKIGRKDICEDFPRRMFRKSLCAEGGWRRIISLFPGKWEYCMETKQEKGETKGHIEEKNVNVRNLGCLHFLG